MKKSFIICLFLLCFVVSVILTIETEEREITATNSTSEIQKKGTPSKYFENWYEPYEEWSPELQNNAIRQIENMADERSLSPLQKNQYGYLASTEPWVQKGPYGIEHLQQNTPNPSFYSYYSGRVVSLAHDGLNGFFIGSANGGLWRKISTIEYSPISDDVQSLAIGGVAVDPSNTNRIFIGTGEYGVSYGTGVYRSTNGGGNWVLLTLEPKPTMVSKILISAAPKYIFAATNQGIYRSADDGDSWVRVFDKSTSDISISPGGFMLAGANKNGIYKSINWGLNWFPLTTDLPSTDIGRISVACAPNHISIAYVQIANRATDSVHGVFKTTNSGSNWSDATPTPEELSDIAPDQKKDNYLGQQWYNNVLTVHPTNSNIVWAGGVYLMRSSDGGNTWRDVGATGVVPRKVHPDIHSLLYVNNRLYVGCDGGVFYTDDEGGSWISTINQFLPITQFYNFATEFNGGRIKYGGTQDNGIIGTSFSTPDYWKLIIGGDGIDASIDLFNSNNIYVTHNGPYKEWRKRSTDGGNNWSAINSTMNAVNDVGQDFWKTYVITDPSSSNRLYANAGVYVYWSTNKGDSWSRMGGYTSMANTKRPSINTNGTFLYLPVDDLYQRLAGFTYVGGANPWSMSYISNGLPDRGVKRVSTKIIDLFQPTNASKAYALINGIGDNNKVFKTTNKGQNWVNISGNLPTNLPVNDVVEITENKLVVGTDKGTFITTNGGANWIRWNSGMPLSTQILDLDISTSDGKWYIVAGTFGRSTFERPITGMDPSFVLVSAKQYLFQLNPGQTKNDCTMVYNKGEANLVISSVWSRNTALIINPTSGTIPPVDSLKFNFTLFVPADGPLGGSRNFNTEIEFIHNAAGSPSVLELVGYIGDPASYRTFIPESLIVKKEIKRKPISTSWCFNFDNDNTQRNPALALFVEFNSPVREFSSYAPFDSAVNMDSRGKKWKFINGSVDPNKSVSIIGKTKGKKYQMVKRWWWTANLVVWDDDFERSVEGILGGIHGKKFPDRQALDLGMPNAANLRKEMFSGYPFSKIQPLVIGVADPDARAKKVAYVAFAKHSDLYGSLTPGRSGKRHDGPPRKFDSFDNNKKMIGAIKKLTPDKQSNRLFAELIAFKLNLNASDIGITPPFKEENAARGTNSFSKPMGVEPSPFRSLRYLDVGYPLHNVHLHEIDSLADVYMTYGDSSGIGSALYLYSVLSNINRAFVGPVDTVSFASRLVLTGVRPIAEVPFLERDTSYYPLTRSMNQTAQTIPDEFEIYQNYPNPFNPTTTIEFYLPISATVTLKVYDVLGREVKTLLDRQAFDEGGTEIEFGASSLASGVYFYQIVAEGIDEDGEHLQPFTSVKKMLLLR